MKKVINKSNLILWIVAIAALIGMIIYIVTSVTGYLTDAVMNPMPVICTVVAIIAAVFAAIGEEKVNAIVYDILIVVVNILLLVSFYWFILGRVSLAADVYYSGKLSGCRGRYIAHFNCWCSILSGRRYYDDCNGIYQKEKID